MPNISVIIPAFNAESRLSETLTSLLNQTFERFEVIIIDDGSTDKTKNIAKKFVQKDKRFKYYYQINQGVSVARNNGIQKSDGKYISFLDADDYYDLTFLEKMFDRIQTTNSDVCYCGYKKIEKNSCKKIKTKFTDNNILLEYLLNKVVINTNCWLIRKEYITKNKTKFRKDISWGEDFEFFCKILSNTTKICYVNEYLTNYVVGHSDEQLSNFSLDKIDDDYKLILRLVNNKEINKNKNIKEALINFRLQGRIIYQLTIAINKKCPSKQINYYYNKYSQYIEKNTLNNGLRSIKLIFNKIKLNFLLKKNNK